MRKSRAAALAVALALLAAPAAARADTDRYFVPEGFHREGVSFGVKTQAGGFLSSSCCDIGGRRGAGGGGIRIATVATDRLLWSLEFEGATVPVKTGDSIEFNRHGTLTLGAQYFLRDTLWVRGGAGFATYKIEQVQQETLVANTQRSGFAVASSLGFDFFRYPNAWSFGFARQDLALSFEINAVGALYPSGKDGATGAKQGWGAIAELTMGFGLQWY